MSQYRKPTFNMSLKIPTGTTHVSPQLFEELVGQILHAKGVTKSELFAYPHSEQDSVDTLREAREIVSGMLKLLGMTHYPYSLSLRGY